MSIKEVWVPDVLSLPPSAYYAQLRPIRDGGNVLSKTKTHHKTIVHNYGHGGAGISLAPGCAIEAVAMAQGEPCTAAAIIGCGIVALFTARDFLRANPKVPLTIYTEKIPVYPNKDNASLITSQVPPGYFNPSNYVPDLKLRKVLAERGLAEYSKLRDSSRYRHCVKDVDVIDIADK